MTLERSPIAELIAPLTTTSEKIRAMARAGYLRTEISEALQIRYQHVRKVLLDSGITEGLQRGGLPAGALPPKTIEPHQPTPGAFLLEAGFVHLGCWVYAGDGEFTLSARAPSKPGVYAFLLDGIVVYVGLTQTGLSTRLGHYRRGHKRQRTSARVKALIGEALAAGQRVEVLVATPEPLLWNGLPVNTAAGLEAGLIRKLRPLWNMLGVGR